MSVSLTKVSASRAVARPLRVLVPLIQDDLEHATSAGLPYYLDAGDKLIEAKGQLTAYGTWGRWLNKHFHLSQQTANLYMRAAEKRATDPTLKPRFQSGDISLNELTGRTEQRRVLRNKYRKTDRAFQSALDDVDTDAVTQSRQNERDEITLHRELALEVIEVGFKALATRLHPDRGGSRDAMARLNRVRSVLKQIAETRRFV